ncbi:MAG TPA: hypothetical protein DEH11_04675 [Actinobacteria bacterium]|nr:hypothetical protein [Actinomycetota bacterium]
MVAAAAQFLAAAASGRTASRLAILLPKPAGGAACRGARCRDRHHASIVTHHNSAKPTLIPIHNRLPPGPKAACAVAGVPSESALG